MNLPQEEGRGAGKQVLVAGLKSDPDARKRSLGVGELLSKEDALYVTGKIWDTEVEWLLDSGCSLSLISLEVYKRIPEGKQLVLEENKVEKRTAYGSLLPDYRKVHLSVTIEKQSFQHPFILANLINEGILGTEFLRIHNGGIDFESNQFSLGGRMLSTKSGLNRNKCYRVSLTEKVVLPARNRMRVAGKVPGERDLDGRVPE